jgi:hypothetical protein
MEVNQWFSLFDRAVKLATDLTSKADQLTETVICTINSVGKRVAGQWQETHNVAVDQSELGLKAQSKFSVDQYDVR